MVGSGGRVMVGHGMKDLDEEGKRETVGETGKKPIPFLHHVPY